MDVAEILALDRDMTDEEFAFLEKQLLGTVRPFFREIQKIAGSIDEELAHLAEQLRSSAASMLLNVELAAGSEDPRQA